MQRNVVLFQLPTLALGATVMAFGSAAAQTPSVRYINPSTINIVKLNAFLTDIRAQLPIYREVRDKFVNVAAPPASTTLEVPKLARDGALVEVEAIAVLPAR
jgi:enamine deaminase RidA (YjgF/YER057c/UK114 family)